MQRRSVITGCYEIVYQGIGESRTLPKGYVRIYVIECLATSLKYIGITVKSLRERWHAHVRDAKDGSSCVVSRAIKKYGPDSFTMTQIATAKNWHDACLSEMAIIEQERTRVPYGYNVTGGGDGTVGRVLSEDLRKRISDARRAWCSANKEQNEAILALARRSKGRFLSEKAVERLERCDSDWGRRTVDGLWGNPIARQRELDRRRAAKEARAALAGRSLGTERSRKSQKGRIFSAEHRARLSAAARRRMQTEAGKAHLLVMRARSPVIRKGRDL